jgi:type I restriction enzyme S subunit
MLNRVIAGVGAAVEIVGKGVAWLIDGSAAIHDDCVAFRQSLNPKFVSYYFQTNVFHSEKGKYLARTNVKRHSGESVCKLAIPSPRAEASARLTSIRDKFFTLVNDLPSGQRADVKARCQQYEYYFDRLLAFGELA